MNNEAGRRVALVTGATSGIGRAIALELSRRSISVAFTYAHNSEAADGLRHRIQTGGGVGTPVMLDLAERSSIEAAVETVEASIGHVDILVNNAVEWPEGPQRLDEAASVDTFERSIRTNLVGPFRLTQRVVGHMRDQQWGRIVHISTGLVDDGLAGSAAYVTAKAGLHGLARVMSRELGADGILTNTVMAGYTPGERQPPEQLLEAITSATATGRTTSPDDVASLVAYLATDDNTHVNGEAIRVDGHFLSPHVPPR